MSDTPEKIATIIYDDEAKTMRVERVPAVEGSQPTEDHGVALDCGANSVGDDWRCTLRRCHAGDHKALNHCTGAVVATWPAASLPPESGTTLVDALMDAVNAHNIAITGDEAFDAWSRVRKCEDDLRTRLATAERSLAEAPAERELRRISHLAMAARDEAAFDAVHRLLDRTRTASTRINKLEIELEEAAARRAQLKAELATTERTLNEAETTIGAFQELCSKLGLRTRIEAAESALASALERERGLRAFATDCAQNFDHEDDAHRYGNGTCRMCNALRALGDPV